MFIAYFVVVLFCCRLQGFSLSYISTSQHWIVGPML